MTTNDEAYANNISEVTEDLEHFEVLSLSTPDLRNMVLFPELIGGKYVRLERPFTIYIRGGRDRFDAWISESPDLKHWGNSSLLLAVEQVPFANDKIGSAAPPVRTDKGWLTIPCGGCGPGQWQARLGGHLEEALYRRNYAAGSGGPPQGESA